VSAPAVLLPEPSTSDAVPPRERAFSRANLAKTVAAGYAPLAIAVLVVFLPLLWMVLSSFKQPGEIVTLDLQALPATLDPENYRVAMTTVPFGQFFLNSTIAPWSAAASK